jgi:hypothetical protein
MSGDHAKREIKTSDKPTSLGKAPSRESGNKTKEGSPPSIKSHRSGDKKKRMKKVVYYETDSSSPSTSSSEASVTSYTFDYLKKDFEMIFQKGFAKTKQVVQMWSEI